MLKRKIISSIVLLSLSAQIVFSANPFDNFKEINIMKAPVSKIVCSAGDGQKIVDFTVLADNSAIAAIVKDKDKKTGLFLWKYNNALEKLDAKIVPALTFEEIAAHPQDQKMFISGKNNKNEYKIYAFDFTSKNFTEIYSSDSELSSLAVSSSKFDDYFRLFFSRKTKGGTEIATITEAGKRFYPVISDSEKVTEEWMDGGGPNTLKEPYAALAGFNPIGNVLFWKNKDDEMSALPYEEKNWGKNVSPAFAKFLEKGDKIEFSPNGLYLLIYSEKKKDITLVKSYSMNPEKLLSLDSKPSAKLKFTADGKGIVYVNDEKEFVYLPLNLPLYDVENAWMFCEGDDDVELFSKNGGLFRPTMNEQMYFIYDSENFDFSGQNYSEQFSARPYLVTIDPFYEILEAAFTGTYYLNEKTVSMNRFGMFVSEAQKAFAGKKGANAAFWSKLFNAADKILKGNYDNVELLRVKNCDGIADSEILQSSNVNFIAFVTRGYYAQDDTMTDYYKAIQYLSLAEPTDEQWALFTGEKKINELLRSWVNSYRPFSNPSKDVLPGSKPEIIKYVKHKETKTTLIPRPWGIDTEIMDSLVFHNDWPVTDQVVGVDGGWRSVPNIYELSYVFGSDMAKKILTSQGVYEAYPILNKIHLELIKRWRLFQKEGITGIYNKWLNLLSVQLSGKKPDWPWLTEDLWDTKQLQTALAGWANLRHSTYIFNEMTIPKASENETGFEFIVRKPPRGAVEPFPEAFGALISVFAELKQVCSNIPKEALAELEQSPGSVLKDGLFNHIDKVINNIDRFKKIAEKEKRREVLSNDDYNAILNCGKAIEYDFLVFKSISTAEHGLAVPKAMPKSVDVYGNATNGYLHACIGFPLEWDLLVPYYGRRQAVKGASYLADSFSVACPVNDDEWYEGNKMKPKCPNWLKDYLSCNQLISPAKTPFLPKE